MLVVSEKLTQQEDSLPPVFYFLCVMLASFIERAYSVCLNRFWAFCK